MTSEAHGRPGRLFQDNACDVDSRSGYSTPCDAPSERGSSPSGRPYACAQQRQRPEQPACLPSHDRDSDSSTHPAPEEGSNNFHLAEASARDDAAQLAQMLIAAELALEAAMAERGDLATAFEKSQRDLETCRAESAEKISAVKDACATPGVGKDAPREEAHTEVEIRCRELHGDVRTGRRAIAAMRKQNEALRTEMAQRDAEWGFRLHAAVMEAEWLRRGLADALADSELQAREFVSSLLQVQTEITVVQSRIETEGVLPSTSCSVALSCSPDWKLSAATGSPTS